MLSATSDDQITLICDAVPLPCVVVEAGTLQIRCGNESVEQLTGRTLAELAGISLRALSVDETAWRGPGGEEIDLGDGMELEFQLQLPGEERIWATAVASGVEVGGEAILVVVLRDVEERRQLEDSLAGTAVELAMASGFPEDEPGPRSTGWTTRGR